MTTPNTPTPPPGYRMLKVGEIKPDGTLVFPDYEGAEWLPSVHTGIAVQPDAVNHYCAPILPSDPVADYRDQCRAKVEKDIQSLNGMIATRNEHDSQNPLNSSLNLWDEAQIAAFQRILTEVLI